VKRLPPLDTHAHVDLAIDADDLIRLGAVVFAVTRSAGDFTKTLDRKDRITTWGVGCHPGLVGVQRSFDADTFAALLPKTSFVGEIGLDGSSRVPLDSQIKTLDDILALVAATPRIASLHSFKATRETLAVLRRHRSGGALLHWWLGDAEETKEALDLGCYFSVNYSMAKRYEHLSLIPADRLLTETDHPSGDRYSPSPRQPGRVQPVEDALAARLGLTAPQVRTRMWLNLHSLIEATGPDLMPLLPLAIQRMLQGAADGTAR
jgi:TatD DNase family protein